MVTLVVYLLIVGIAVYLISRRGRPFSSRSVRTLPRESQSIRPGSNGGSREIWRQVYETASMDEARSIQTSLAQEGIEGILYEQGKKDIHGNLLKGVGVAVPSTAASRAQAIIAKMPV